MYKYSTLTELLSMNGSDRRDGACRRPLIIGIGNPLRSADGLGWAVAERREQDRETG